MVMAGLLESLASGSTDLADVRERTVTDASAPSGSGTPNSAYVPARRQNGIGTAALVVGVVSLVLAVLIIFAPLAVLLGLVATVLGIAAVIRVNRGAADNHGQAVAGLITGPTGSGASAQRDRRIGAAGTGRKPANLMVRDGRVLLIDVFFAEVCPSPWRQAVDLANMLLVLGLRSEPQRVYEP